mgnify:CR=1 FL=1
MNTSQLYTKQQIILRVAIPSPLRRIFDYVLPETDLEFAPSIGARVLVPFGRQTLTGTITAIADNSTWPIKQLKPIVQVLEAEALIPNKLRELLLWASNYYQYPLGLLLDSAMPAWFRKNKTSHHRFEISREQKNPKYGFDRNSLDDL